MNELLCKALDEIYETEFDKYKTGEKHFFSFRHRRMMRKLFKELDAKPESEAAAEVYTYKAKKRRPVALIVAIIFSVILSITAAAYAIYSFGFKKQSDHTVAFSKNIENSPSTIEYVYEIEPLPVGFEKNSQTIGFSVSSSTYQSYTSILSLRQWVKKEYICNYNTEGYEIEEIDVNGHDGFYLKLNKNSFLIWDNGDYILELYGSLDKDELLNLSKQTKIQQIKKSS